MNFIHSRVVLFHCFQVISFFQVVLLVGFRTESRLRKAYIHLDGSALMQRHQLFAQMYRTFDHKSRWPNSTIGVAPKNDFTLGELYERSVFS